eukprot:Em0004g630a
MRNIRFGQCRIIHSQPLESGRGVDIVLFGTRLIASGGFTTGPMEGKGRFRAACHHDSPHCRVQRVTHPQDEPVTGSGRYRHSSMSPRQSTLQGEESDPPPRAACHRDSPHCRVKRVTHPQDEPVGVTATAACHHDSPYCRVQRVTHPQDEPVTGSGRYRHSSISPRQSTLQGEESDPSPR